MAPKKLLFLLLVVSFVGFSCKQNADKRQNRNSSVFSPLLNEATDSLSNNSSYALTLIDSVLKHTDDSLTIYHARLLKTSVESLFHPSDSIPVRVNEILAYCSRTKNSDETNLLRASAFNVLGGYYQRGGYLDSAICCFQKSLYENMSHYDRNKYIDVLINLGDAYLSQGKYVNSSQYFHRALFLCDSLKLDDKLGFPIYFGLGQLYLAMHDFTASDFFFSKAEKVFDSRSLNEKVVFANNRGNYYYYSKEYAKALPWFVKSKLLAEPKGYDYIVRLAELNMSDVFLQMGALDSSSYYVNKCEPFFKSINQATALYYITSIKAGVALKHGLVGEANKLLATNADTAGIEPSMLTIRYGYLEDYYKRIGNYRQAYRYFQARSKIDNKLQADRIRNRVDEHKMRYKSDTTILRRDWKIQVQNEEINSLRLSQLVWLLVSIIVLGGIGVGILLYRRQQNLKAVQFTNKIIQLRLESARRRISPHFIFNALNRLVLSPESDYDRQELQKLTKFLRKGVDISNNLDIPLADELNFVLLYVQIECSTFGSDFSLNYKVDQSIDMSQVNVPAMIVQIPVENAIKHALRPLKGKKELGIKVSKTGGGICIQITDNGAGYHPEANGRIGVGLKTIYQTIQILNSVNAEPMKFNIVNNSDNGGIGVTVNIFIPLNFKYNL